jgi:hypothetical protein
VKKDPILDLSPHKLNEMTRRTEKPEIGEQVAELGKMGSALYLLQPGQSKDETDGAMRSIVAGIGRLESSISGIADRQRATLLDVVHFDVRQALQTLGYIRWDITLTGGGDDAVKAVDDAIRLARELESLSRKIEGDAATQRELYDRMVEDYRAREWSRDYWRFVRQVKEDMEGRPDVGLLQRRLSEMRQTRLNSYMPAAVRRLYDSVVNCSCTTCEAIVSGRRELTDDDIAEFFSFLMRYSALKGHIDSVHLLKPVTGKYEKLFTCRAAKEYVDLLSPALMTYGGIEEKGHFAILLLVMNDLGLSEIANKPYLQMMNYANEVNTDDDALRFGADQSSISKIGGKLGTTPFCELEYGDAGDTKIETAKMEGYQEVYRRCFNILNFGGLRLPEEMKVASYLSPASQVVDMKIVVEVYSPEQLQRLRFLRSVLRRETLVFG